MRAHGPGNTQQGAATSTNLTPGLARLCSEASGLQLTLRVCKHWRLQPQPLGAWRQSHLLPGDSVIPRKCCAPLSQLLNQLPQARCTGPRPGGGTQPILCNVSQRIPELLPLSWLLHEFLNAGALLGVFSANASEHVCHHPAPPCPWDREERDVNAAPDPAAVCWRAGTGEDAPREQPVPGCVPEQAAVSRALELAHLCEQQQRPSNSR